MDVPSGYISQVTTAQVLQWPPPSAGRGGPWLSKVQEKRDADVGLGRVGQAFSSTNILLLNSPFWCSLNGHDNYPVCQEKGRAAVNFTHVAGPGAGR